MAKFTKKITNLIDQQVPEFVLSDHPKFLEFVKTYFKFMESAEIIVDNIELTDGIRLETETAQENNLVLNASRLDTDRTSLDAGDKKSFDPLKPHEWKDCSESDSKYAKVPAEIHGFVGFNDTEGGGALRIGAHDDRDVIVLKGLDVSARNMPS